MPDAALSDRRFSLTESAARRIARLRESEPNGDALMMRVAVLGGGCSGFQYKFDFDDTVNDDDHVFERDGQKVLVDDVSLDLLAGAQLDYKDELIGAYFAVENPNATSSCGCGTSFAIG
ncbi:heme biosynthesis protein HemY [Thalassobaculum fulvum]|jgi:iron-sulfur cluster insertion protein|uniref:Heme biosynthesis protein HemY n=1 Tax=Thalassobaculum fulvum TaxID=1633335 RepID=A0A918XQW3_9PROT|nr:iron-sulfur cluster insertion protein ErpA [Thalassobaculum fulvum]GHD48273.1 heme biosynthesis protein HemY [Thalassobaculum fulvum]